MIFGRNNYSLISSKPSFLFATLTPSTQLYLLACTLLAVPVLGVGLWKVLCVLSFPIAFVKSGISLIHLWVASENIVGIDMADREQAKTQ